MSSEHPHSVTSVEALEKLYAAPSERAVRKEIDHIDEHCRAFIGASPFVVLASSSGRGADCSPRGEEPGFVRVAGPRTLLIPDRRGNNRLDSLRNIVENPEVGLLFLVPGVSETLRVNGRATISTDPAILDRFAISGRAATTVLEVAVREAFIQCAKALVRSDLWNPQRHVDRSTLPSLGTILAAHTSGLVDPAAYDAETARALGKL
ncbi:MAG: pyridoxamine 5'-phosphate oxidase family protein [Gemmatimonadota bacterium]